MADLTAEIDRLTREHAERCGACLGALPADRPDACEACKSSYAGPAIPEEILSVAALERRRLFGPTALTMPVAGPPPVDVSAFDRDAAALRGDWARVGALWSTALTSTVAGPLPDIEDWDHGDVVITLKRLPWWRRIWRRRG